MHGPLRCRSRVTTALYVREPVTWTPRSQESLEILHAEFEAARRAGLRVVRMAPRAPVPSFNSGPSLRFPHQAQFHPLAYLGALVGAIERCGGRIFGGTHVTGVEAGPPAVVSTESGRQGHRRLRGLRHQHADHRLARHRQHVGSLPHVRHRGASGAGLGAGDALLGHRRPLSLRAAGTEACSSWSARTARPDRRTTLATKVRLSRVVGLRALSDRRGGVQLVRPRRWIRRMALATSD